MFHGHDDALAAYDAHALALGDAAAILGYGAPLVAVDFYIAVAVGADGLDDDTLTTEKGVGIARTVGLVGMQIPQRKGANAIHAQHRATANTSTCTQKGTGNRETTMEHAAPSAKHMR